MASCSEMSVPIPNDLAVTEITKLSKPDKKLRKKQKKYREILETNEGIYLSDIPTKVLCIHNGGLDNGVSREEISSLMYRDGNIADIMMFPRKPYSFICFKTEDDALKVVKEFNGFEIPHNKKRQHSVILYFSFVTKVPKSVAPCKDLPPGLVILENFISEIEETELISSLHWKDEGQLKHREVKHFGYEFKYDVNDIDADDPLPESIPTVCNKFLERALDTGYVQHYPDQLTVNKYVSGQGIPPHVDTAEAFEDGIMSLSLLSQIVMEFTHPNGRQLSVLLPRRSLLIMTGESRYVWSHGITPKKSDIVNLTNGLDLLMRETRISFTFRKIIHPEERINRIIPFQTSKLNILLPKSQTEAIKLESSHVQKVYEEIAEHFSGTRHTPWPRIAKFIQTMPVGSIMADIGCGNGKYLGLNKSIFEIGSDKSLNLSEICHERLHQVFVGDVLNIPLRSCSFDFCTCIAVIHHMSTEERRLQAIKELLRILRPSGKLLIYVWAMEQVLHKVKSKYLKETKLQECSHGDISDQMKKLCPVQEVNTQLNNNLESAESSFLGDKKAETCSKEVDNSSCYMADFEGEQPVNKSSNNKFEMSDENNLIKNSLTHVLSVHKNRTNFQQQDVLVPWERKFKDSNTTCFHRYYHVFREGELEEICGGIDECQLIDRYYDQGNWAVVLQKQ